MSQSPFLGVPVEESASTEDGSELGESAADGSVVESSVDEPLVASSGNGSFGESSGDGDTQDVATLVAEQDVQAVLDAVEDPDCRAILSATREEALSASELSTRCDLPLSTTYRKIDTLTEAGLLSERTRIRDSGKHTSEFTPRIGDLTVSLGPDGEFSVRIWRTGGAGVAAETRTE